MSSEHRIYGETHPTPPETINTMMIADAAMATRIPADTIRGLCDSGQILFPYRAEGFSARVFVSSFHRPDGTTGFGLI